MEVEVFVLGKINQIQKFKVSYFLSCANEIKTYIYMCVYIHIYVHNVYVNVYECVEYEWGHKIRMP